MRGRIERRVLVHDPIGEGLENHYPTWVFADGDSIYCPLCGTWLDLPDTGVVYCSICKQGYEWAENE